MWPWQWHWDFALGATWAGIILTFVLGVWNLFVGRAHNDKTRFINTVTNQRVIWIEQLRGDLATFIALADGMIEDPKIHVGVQTVENRRDLRRLRRLITLRLNPKDDEEIAKLLPDIEKAALSSTSTEQGRGLDKLSELAGGLLKTEWDKVQDEAEKGRLKKKMKEARKAQSANVPEPVCRGNGDAK